MIDTKRISLILLTGVFLGSSVVMNRFALSEIPPLAFVALRLTAVTIAFAITLVALGKALPRESRFWIDIALVGMGQGLSLIAFTLALQFISSALLTIFIALIPVFTGIIAHFWLAQEKLSAIKVAGLSAALVGVLVLLLTGTTGLSAAISLDLRGHALAFGGALFGATSTTYTRRRLRRADVFVVTALQFALPTIAIAPLVFASTPFNLSAITVRGWSGVLYTALIGSYLGFLAMFYMTKNYGATIAVLPAYVMPAVSATLGVSLLNEVITFPLIGGAILILLGVFLASR